MKKKIPSSTEPKVSNDSRKMNPPSTTTHLRTEELVVIECPIRSRGLYNDRGAGESGEVPKKIVEKEEVVEEQIAQETLQSPYDTQLEIKVVKSFFTSHLSEVQDQTINDYEESAGIQEDYNSDLQSIPDDDLRSVSRFQATDSDDTYQNEVSHSVHTSQDDIASVERLSILDHLDHICEEVSYLYSRLGNIESSIVQTDCLPLIVKESLQTYNLAVSEQFAEIQKELSKVIKSKVAKKVQVVGLNGVHEDLQSQTKHISKYSSSFQDIQTQLQEVKDLLKSVVIIDETVDGEKKQKDTNAIPALT
ncbi:hypothetical protein Tco_0920524 [Tanacetum coccineum]